MTAEQPPVQSGQVIAVLFTDLVGSVDLKGRLGNRAYGTLIARHDELFRQIVAGIRGGRVIQDTGDGFFAAFNSAADAAAAGLAFQQALRSEPWPDARPEVRVGIHIGQVEAVGEGRGPAKLVGLAPDIAARIMGLAQGGQILLSRHAFDDARQYLREHPPVAGAGQPLDLQWVAHGRYVLKHYDEPLEVYEVGARGLAPLTPPPDSEKAWRVVQPEEAELLGWRPANGLTIPGHPDWQLSRKLGEGGVGEVWLAQHRRLGSQHVFKFCFDVEQLRSLKRELTLFRLISSTLGERPDIAALYDVHLDQPPYYLESAFSEYGDLQSWSQRIGGIATLPLPQRLRLIADIARAVAAAHSVGILHKDIKPANVLIGQGEGGRAMPQLADFGIGELMDRSRLLQAGITETGFTATVFAKDGSSTGTPMYMPPEALAGRPFSVQGDIYALGVMLYQMVVGDLARPMGQGWQRNIEDELLIEDIAGCVDVDPGRRFASARELADRLDRLEQRHRELVQRRQQALLEQRRRRRARVGLIASLTLLLVAALATLALLREQSLRQRAEDEALRARLAETRANAVSDFLTDMLHGADPLRAQGRQLTVKDVLDQAATKLQQQHELASDPRAEGSVRNVLGETYYNLAEYAAAEQQLDQAIALFKQYEGADSRYALGAANDLARIYLDTDRFDQAETLLQDTLSRQRKALGTDDPLTIDAMRLLGVLYASRSRFAEAETVYAEALALAERRLGPDDPETLSLLTNLVTTRVSLGETEGLEAQFRELLKRQQRVRGEKNPHTLLARQNFAIFLNGQGRYAEAEAELLAIAPLLKEIYGPEHPRSLLVEIYLGEIWIRLGKLQEAESLMTGTYAAHQRTLGEDDSWTLYAGMVLAQARLQRGEVEAAAELLADILARQQRLLGDDHLDVALTALALAEARNVQQRYSEAESLSQTTVRGFEAVLGSEHPELVQPLYQLFLSQSGQDKSAEAAATAARLRELIQHNPGLSEEERQAMLNQLNQPPAGDP